MLIFVAFWCIIWCFDAIKKGCKLLICSLFLLFFVARRGIEPLFLE